MRTATLVVDKSCKCCWKIRLVDAQRFTVWRNRAPARRRGRGAGAAGSLGSAAWIPDSRGKGGDATAEGRLVSAQGRRGFPPHTVPIGLRCIGSCCKRGHGLCWYAYWREHGKLRERYLSKHQPG